MSLANLQNPLCVNDDVEINQCNIRTENGVCDYSLIYIVDRSLHSILLVSEQ